MDIGSIGTLVFWALLTLGLASLLGFKFGIKLARTRKFREIVADIISETAADRLKFFRMLFSKVPEQELNNVSKELYLVQMHRDREEENQPAKPPSKPQIFPKDVTNKGRRNSPNTGV